MHHPSAHFFTLENSDLPNIQCQQYVATYAA